RSPDRPTGPPAPPGLADADRRAAWLPRARHRRRPLARRPEAGRLRPRRRPRVSGRRREHLAGHRRGPLPRPRHRGDLLGPARPGPGRRGPGSVRDRRVRLAGAAMTAGSEVVIVGGGVIGLSIAYVLAREGVAATVLDRGELGRAASWAGAGIIAPEG